MKFKKISEIILTIIVMILLSNMVYFIHDTYFLFIYIPIIYFLYNKQGSINLSNKFKKQNIKSERVFSEKERTFEINKNIYKEEYVYMKILKLNTEISELSLKELKKAYIRESKIFHPDNGGNSEKMKEINLAYAKLKKLISVQPAKAK